MKNDGTLRVKVERSNNPQTYTGSNTGAVVDTLGYEYARVILSAGTFTSTAAMNVFLRTSDNDSSGFTDIDGAAFAEVTTANHQTAYIGILRLDGVERYLRCQATYSGSGNAPISTVIELVNGQYTDGDTATSFAV